MVAALPIWVEWVTKPIELRIVEIRSPGLFNQAGAFVWQGLHFIGLKSNN